jgi:hypothetical protein
MRLADLHPVVTAAGKGDLNELTFDCPRCGPPYRICVYMRLHGPAGNGVWAWEMGPPGQLENITVNPSIDNPNHGRKKVCGFHCTITNGDVIPH